MNWLTLLVLFLSVSLATGGWPFRQPGTMYQRQSPETNAELAKKSGKRSVNKRSEDGVHHNDDDPTIPVPG